MSGDVLKSIIKSGIITFFITLIYAAAAQANEIYFIDAHSQIDHQVVPLKKIITVMKAGGVSHTILSARGKLKGNELMAMASQYPKYITPAVRTKGKSYDTGSAKYYKQLDQQVASRNFSAMAEVLLYHAQKGDKAAEYVIYPEDERVGAALKHAIENNWPFVIHIEFSALYGKQKKRFMNSLEKMLDQSPDHPFVLTHMGQLKPAECRRLIETHENLYFHTGWTNPAALKKSKQPWTNLFEGQVLSSAWHDLFIQHSDRFIFALDNVFVEHWHDDFYIKQMEYWKKALSELPAEVAHHIAHGNAERLWNITPMN